MARNSNFRGRNNFNYRDTFEYNLNSATDRIYAQLNKGIDEAGYVSRYLKTLVNHLSELLKANPSATNDELTEILFNEIDDYAKTVFENSYVFGQYLEYTCCQYMIQHPDKYKEISQKLIDSDLDFENMSFGDCRNFDEYLLFYTYSKKRDLFNQIFENMTPPIPATPDNYKRFDELLQENISMASRTYFSEWFQLPQIYEVFTSSDSLPKKKAKIKEYSTWYRNPKDRKDFIQYANVFLYGTYPYISTDLPYVEQEIRKDVARATSRTVEQLDKLGHLDNYMTDFVFEMIRMQYPEFASIVCKNGFITENFVDEIVSLSDNILELEKQYSVLPNNSREKDSISRKLAHLRVTLNKKKAEISSNIDKEKLKNSLGENFLKNSKTLSIDSLLALNAFWANRYVKELDLYSEAMFAVHKFDLINKIKKGENTNINDTDLFNMLIQMDTFYNPANNFLSKKQSELSKQKVDNSSEEYEEGDVEEKIIRFSYQPFIDTVAKKFGANPYSRHFSTVLPNVEHDIKKDADWYIRLHNPVFSSYLMKDEMINCLLLQIDTSANFPNAGIILEDFNGSSLEVPDGTSASIPYSPVIGIDAGLSFPVRVHSKKDVMIDFLKSFKGNAIIPIYEGAADFHHPYKNNTPMAAPVIMPITDKIKGLFKQGIRKNENTSSPDYHPHGRLVSHLAFQSSKKPPYHLQNFVSGKSKSKPTFIRRYIDLETGDIYNKVNDKYVPVESKPISIQKQGDGGYEI